MSALVFVCALHLRSPAAAWRPSFVCGGNPAGCVTGLTGAGHISQCSVREACWLTQQSTYVSQVLSLRVLSSFAHVFYQCAVLLTYVELGCHSLNDTRLAWVLPEASLGSLAVVSGVC